MKLEEELKGNFKSIHDKAHLNIIYTGAWLVDQLNSILKPFGLTEPQYNVLRVLRPQKDHPVTLSYLHERMVHKSSNTTRLVQKLVEKKWVSRKTNPSNRREVNITISPEGLALLDTLYPLTKKYQKKFHQKITLKEAEFLADILDRIRD